MCLLVYFKQKNRKERINLSAKLSLMKLSIKNALSDIFQFDSPRNGCYLSFDMCVTLEIHCSRRVRCDQIGYHFQSPIFRFDYTLSSGFCHVKTHLGNWSDNINQIRSISLQKNEMIISFLHAKHQNIFCVIFFDFKWMLVFHFSCLKFTPSSIFFKYRRWMELVWFDERLSFILSTSVEESSASRSAR